MARLTFYEKPGCGGNARQRALLQADGHALERRDLLTAAWTPQRLTEVFGDLPVALWFNRAAPKVKSGQVRPETLNRPQALALLCEEPLLIRRPLMQREDGAWLVGFDPEAVRGFIGGGLERATAAMEGCAAKPVATPCPSPAPIQAPADTDPMPSPAGGSPRPKPIAFHP